MSLTSPRAIVYVTIDKVCKSVETMKDNSIEFIELTKKLKQS